MWISSVMEMKDLKRLLLLAYDLAGDVEIVEQLISQYVNSSDDEKARGAQISYNYLLTKLITKLDEIEVLKSQIKKRT